MKKNFHSLNLLPVLTVIFASLTVPTFAQEKRRAPAQIQKNQETASTPADIKQSLALISLGSAKMNELRRQRKSLMADVETQMGKLIDNIEQMSEPQIRELFKSLANLTEEDPSNSIGQVLEVFMNSKRSKQIKKILQEVDIGGDLQDALDRLEKEGNS